MRKLLSLFLVLLSLSTFAQTISAIIIDEQSHPLSFVAVSIAGAKDGTYTDDAGRFSLDASGLKETDQLILSHIGYVEVKTTVAQLMALKGPIQLQPKNYSLQEVLVGPGNAKDMLMDALSHIKDNHPGEFTKNHIEFKEYLKINGHASNYEFFNFNMFLPSYLAKDSPRIYSEDINHEIYTLKGEMANKAFSPMRFLKNIYPERIFDEKTLKENDFALVSTSVVIDSEEYDVINFKHRPQKAEKSIRIVGNAYINKKDKGIRFVDLHVYNEHSDRFMLLVKLDTLDYNLKIAYKKTEGKYAVDYISQSIYGSGKFFGKHVNISQAVSARVMDRLMHLKMNEIIMRTDIDDIFTNEKPRDIQDMKESPDIK